MTSRFSGLRASFWATGLILVLFLQAFPRTIRVPENYLTIPEAITAASGGDTILVGNGTYNSGAGQIQVTKRLIILGNGYKDISNGGSHVGGGFNLTANADRSVITGFRFTEAQNPNIYIEDGCNRIVITQNYFTQLNWAIRSFGDNDTISKNIIRGGIYFSDALENVVQNNILYNAYNYYLIQATGNCAFLQINNNVFSNAYYAFALTTPVSTMIYGNLFTSINNIYPEAANVYLYSGNWKWNSAGNEPANAFENGDGDPKFRNYDGQNYTYNDDPLQGSDVRLSETSPCIDYSFQTGVPPIGPEYLDIIGSGGLGTARVDCGIFGGPKPFPDAFEPSTKPEVINLLVTPTPASPSGTITIEASGKISSK